jgi:Raf kinase inhibitor-like YbhB/YbcL family protein
MNKKLMMVNILIIGSIMMCAGCAEEKQRKFGDLTLSSPAFDNGESIPVEYTCYGANVSPALTFSNIPEDTQSLALIMDDPDAGSFVHWIIWNIPSNTTGFSKGEQIPFPQGINNFGVVGYRGPCPPSGIHHYSFRLYALDTILTLPAGATEAQLEEAMSSHIIEEAELIGTYSR